MVAMDSSGSAGPKHLEENFAAIDVSLTAQDIEEIDALFTSNHDYGQRYAADSPFASA